MFKFYLNGPIKIIASMEESNMGTFIKYNKLFSINQSESSNITKGNSDGQGHRIESPAV